MSVGVGLSGACLKGAALLGFSDVLLALGLISVKLLSVEWDQYSWNTPGQVLSVALKPLLVSKAPGSRLATKLERECDWF